MENGEGNYHAQRKLALYPTKYEQPECAECRNLKDAMVDAENSLRSCRPDTGSYKSKFRWPKAWKEEHYRLEKAANLVRANYEIHLGTVHQDKSHQHDLGRNLDTRLRDGRLKL
jgi:hypothetical protein